MTMIKTVLSILCLLPAGRALAGTAPKGKLLVVMSSESKITLKNNVVHPTGFFLPELMVPLKAAMDAGYEPEFANPRGNKAVMDKISDNASWFGDAPNASTEEKAAAQRVYREIRALCGQLGLCGDGVEGTRDLRSLSSVISEGLDRYDGLLVPGGHAPMEDLWRNRELGTILRHFHKKKKPTALICHAPIALLSAMDKPERFIEALTLGDHAAMAKLARNWIYGKYAMTVFTTPEEKQEEPGQDNRLGGFVQFYPDEALEKAGATVRRAAKWNPNAVEDRELITGQNPMSDKALAAALVKALEAFSPR